MPARPTGAVQHGASDQNKQGTQPVKIVDSLLRDRQIRGNAALVDNHYDCHCGKSSPHSADWWVVQDWLREHGFGRAC